MKNQKYALMTYSKQSGYNLGDYIQSLAAKQYLPHVDHYISRDHLSEYNREKVKMIMNGWYMGNPANWPPSKLIDPLFVSMHINESAKETMLQDAGVNYFKLLERPIGCRDMFTTRILQEKGINAHYSGCLTTTLDLKYKSDYKTDNIYIVDPFYYNPSWEAILSSKRNFIKGIMDGEFLKVGLKNKLLESVFTKELLKSSQYIKHWFDKEVHDEDKRFELAEQVLRKYAEAKLVITSRIHCALPCLALGTPVIFLNYGLDFDVSSCRLEGILELFNVINIDDKGNKEANFNLPDGKIDGNLTISNPDRYKKLADALKEKCKAFIRSE